MKKIELDKLEVKRTLRNTLKGTNRSVHVHSHAG
jgi:hypothetical protein